jgi:hypothetical protein
MFCLFLRFPKTARQGANFNGIRIGHTQWTTEIVKFFRRQQQAGNKNG